MKNDYNLVISSYLPAYEDGTDSVPKRRHIKVRRRGITQKKAYNYTVILLLCSCWDQYCELAYINHVIKIFKPEMHVNNTCTVIVPVTSTLCRR